MLADTLLVLETAFRNFSIFVMQLVNNVIRPHVVLNDLYSCSACAIICTHFLDFSEQTYHQYDNIKFSKTTVVLIICALNIFDSIYISFLLNEILHNISYKILNNYNLKNAN